MNKINYVGQELEIFEKAVNWKRYFASRIQVQLGGDVLEVGAGIGANTPFLKGERASSWMCLEPDPRLVCEMRARFRKTGTELSDCRIENGTTETIDRSYRFDAIVYIDVLEHIEDDKGELSRAADLLRAGGKIVVLVPGHQWLYTEFDRSIGHFRRYDKVSLRLCEPARCRLVRLDYLDSVGLLASMANKVLLNKAMPTAQQIRFWDKVLVPLSRFADPLSFHRIGKSLLAIWSKG